MLASDIHIEPNGQEYRVRFRLDGMLAEIEESIQQGRGNE
jgi:type II secretory ATPase GspE/PulE/Tfp pilus assembly ATPase PilB-like protein